MTFEAIILFQPTLLLIVGITEARSILVLRYLPRSTLIDKAAFQMELG